MHLCVLFPDDQTKFDPGLNEWNEASFHPFFIHLGFHCAGYVTAVCPRCIEDLEGGAPAGRERPLGKIQDQCTVKLRNVFVSGCRELLACLPLSLGTVGKG